MIIDRDMLEIHRIAGSTFGVDAPKVKVEADGTMVATDGHILAVVKPSGMSEMDYPNVEGATPAADSAGLKLEPFMVPADGIKALQKAIPKNAER
jgi:hypothetical protein